MATTPPDRPERPKVPREQLQERLRQHGEHSLAYATLQPELAHFFIPQLGFIAYRAWRGYTIVLSNPVCEPRRRRLLLEQFLRHHDRPVFVHVSTGTASDLAQLDFSCTVMGQESWLDLRSFEPTWGSHNALRESQRRFKKIEAEIFETRFSELQQHGLSVDRLREISDRWLNERPGREMRFLLRPVVYEDEPDVRLFCMRCDNRVVGFTVFDPVYRAGSIVGYCSSISRWDDRDIPTGRSAAVNLHAAEVFAGEGIRTMALGLLPFAGDLRSPFPDSALIRFCFAMAPHAITRFDFASLAEHKRQYKGDLTDVFYASRQRGPGALRELAAVGRLIGLI